MRIAVISDVHGNLVALDAVLRAIDEQPVDELWCLGDVVGYGPRPNECVDQIRTRAHTSLAGNHDLVVTGAIALDVFASDAGAAVRWTRAVIRDEPLAYLRTLEPQGKREGIELYHGSIRNPVWEYVIDNHTAAVCLELQQTRVALIGHSHVALMYGYADDEFFGRLAPGGSMLDLRQGPYLLNPGSVGQPRDGDPRACYTIIDDDMVRFRRVEYPMDQTIRKIYEIPELDNFLGDRLRDGR